MEDEEDYEIDDDFVFDLEEIKRAEKSAKADIKKEDEEKNGRKHS